MRVDGAHRHARDVLTASSPAPCGAKGDHGRVHRDVCEGAGALLRAEERRSSRAWPGAESVPSSHRFFPDARPPRVWANIASGKASITEVTRSAGTAVYYDKSSTTARVESQGGASAAVHLHTRDLRIRPSRGAIETVQCSSSRKQAWKTQARRARRRSERCSVVFGGGRNRAQRGVRSALWPALRRSNPARLDAASLLTEDSFPGVLTNVIAGRIANRLDLGGVNYTVDAACAASLAAVDLAVKELSQGSSDMVLCGGADVHNSIVDYLLFASVHALSPTGACRAFDSSADGIVLGEGVACVVLKRLADAERDGDRIYAVIKGVAGGSDGKSLGLTAPRKEGQVRALCRAYRAAGVSPREVGLVEAHGTGTVVGDRTELATLTEVYGAAGVPAGSVALGSVKSQIGHTKCAAGIAGLIKVALSLHHKVLPPTLHIQKENPGYDAASSPFVFGDVARPWPGEDRKGAVSAFGFGGTNFHAVLAAYDGADAPASGLGDWPAELFLFRAPDRAGALAQVDRLAAYLGDGSGPSPRLCDLARSGSETAPRRRAVAVAVVATSAADLARQAGARPTFTRDPARRFVPRADVGEGKTASSSRPGQPAPVMLAELFVAFPPAALPAARRALGIASTRRSAPARRGARRRRRAHRTRAPSPRWDGVAGRWPSCSARSGGAPKVVPDTAMASWAACLRGRARGRELFELSAARGRCILEAAGDDPAPWPRSPARRTRCGRRSTASTAW